MPCVRPSGYATVLAVVRADRRHPHQGPLARRCLRGAATRVRELTARPFYRDRHGDAYITQCAGCLLAARLRDVLVTRPPLEELYSALQQAFEAYVRRQIERTPPPPVDETPGTSASNPPPPPPLVSQQRGEFFGR